MNQELQTVMMTEIKKMIDAAIEEISARTQTGLQQLHTRLDSLSAENGALREELTTLKTECDRKELRLQALTADIERMKRHSYAYDVLLHGIPEQPSDSPENLAGIVSSFLTNHGGDTLLQDVELYAHRLGPVRRALTSTSTSPTLRPRPIIFRMRSRSTQTALVEKLSKRNCQKDSPYLSHHLTPGEIEKLKLKHAKAGTKRSTEAMAHSAPKGRRH